MSITLQKVDGYVTLLQDETRKHFILYRTKDAGYEILKTSESLGAYKKIKDLPDGFSYSKTVTLGLRPEPIKASSDFTPVLPLKSITLQHNDISKILKAQLNQTYYVNDGKLLIDANNTYNVTMTEELVQGGHRGANYTIILQGSTKLTLDVYSEDRQLTLPKLEFTFTDNGVLVNGIKVGKIQQGGSSKFTFWYENKRYTRTIVLSKRGVKQVKINGEMIPIKKVKMHN